MGLHLTVFVFQFMLLRTVWVECSCYNSTYHVNLCKILCKYNIGLNAPRMKMLCMFFSFSSHKMFSLQCPKKPTLSLSLSPDAYGKFEIYSMVSFCDNIVFCLQHFVGLCERCKFGFAKNCVFNTRCARDIYLLPGLAIQNIQAENLHLLWHVAWMRMYIESSWQNSVQ